MALVWVDEMIGLMADCWAEEMDVMRVGTRFGWMSTRRAGHKAVNWIDGIAGSMADCQTERIVMASAS